MTATKQDIKRWFEEGKRAGATHVIIACDTWDSEDYPVYIFSNKEAMGDYPIGRVGTAREVYEEIRGKEMQKVMEVYNLSTDMNVQLNERRACNF